MPKLAYFILLMMSIPLHLSGLTFINNYKGDVTVSLFKNDKNNDQNRILETTIKSGTMVTLKTNIAPTDYIYVVIFCKKWIRKHGSNGPMFFMRTSANPEGIHNWYLGREFNNNCALLLQREPGSLAYDGTLHVISPEILQNPIIQNRIKSGMNQDYSWWDRSIKGKDRKPIDLNL